MVGNAADSQRLHLIASRNPAHVSPESRLELFRNAGDPVPGRKYAMKQQAGFCVVGHRLAILMLSRPCRDFSFAYAYPALERLRRSACRATLSRACRRSKLDPDPMLISTHIPADVPLSL